MRCGRLALWPLGTWLFLVFVGTGFVETGLAAPRKKIHRVTRISAELATYSHAGGGPPARFIMTKGV